MDRQVLSILAPTLQRELIWSESQYAAVVYSFTFVYAFGFLIAGRWLDRVGVRRGFATAVVVWSLAAIGHALARTTAAFSAARALLGLGESANFPGAIKSVGEWFPKAERALATGIFNAGTNTGATLTPLIVPLIALNWGWRWAFVVTGSLGFLWLVRWLAVEWSAQTRLERESRAQDGDAAHGARDRAHGAGAARGKHVDRRAHRQPGGRRAPGLVGQRLYARERHVPAERRGVRLRHRRLRRRYGRRAVPVAHRPDSRRDRRQLRLDLRRLRLRLRHGLDDHSFAGAKA